MNEEKFKKQNKLNKNQAVKPNRAPLNDNEIFMNSIVQKDNNVNVKIYVEEDLTDPSASIDLSTKQKEEQSTA